MSELSNDLDHSLSYFEQDPRHDTFVSYDEYREWADKSEDSYSIESDFYASYDDWVDLRAGERSLYDEPNSIYTPGNGIIGFCNSPLAWEADCFPAGSETD